MVEHGCNPSTWEAEAGGSPIQCQPELDGKFKPSLGYIMRLTSKQKQKQKQKTKGQNQTKPPPPSPNKQNQGLEEYLK
jgi:hypothetical protein